MHKVIKNGLVGIIISVLHLIVIIILYKNSNNNLLWYHYVFAFLAFLMYGFLISMVIGLLLDRYRLRDWLKGGILGIVYTLIFSVIISSLIANVIGTGFNGFILLFTTTFIIWTVPSFVFGIIANYVVKKLER